MVSWCKHCVCKCQNNASVLIVCPDRSLAPSPPLPPLCLSLAHAEPGLQPALVPPCLASPARLVLLLHQGPWPTGRGEASQRVLVRDLSGRRPPAPTPESSPTPVPVWSSAAVVQAASCSTPAHQASHHCVMMNHHNESGNHQQQHQSPLHHNYPPMGKQPLISHTMLEMLAVQSTLSHYQSQARDLAQRCHQVWCCVTWHPFIWNKNQNV